MTCILCHHPNAAAINAALTAGTGVRTVATRYGLAKTTTLRHKTRCLPALKGAHAMPTETVSEGSTLAKLEARIAGMSREMSALRDEVDRLTAQYASDHAFVQQMAELVYVTATDPATQQKIMQTFRQDGNSVDPFTQQIRRMTHQPVLPVYATKDPKPLPPIDKPTPGTPWWHVLHVLGKIANDNDKEE